MRISEKALVENPVLRKADELGIAHIKLNLQGRRGYPDREFFVPGGRPLLVEFKAPGEGPEPLQAHVIRKLRRLGYDVHVVDDPREGIRILQEALEAAQGAEGRGSVHGQEPGRPGVGRTRRR